MQQDFAGSFAFARDLFAFDVNDAHVVGLEVSFADQTRRAEDAILAHAEGVIPLVAGAKSFDPDAPADVAHLLTEFPFADDAFAVVSSVAVFAVCHSFTD